MGDGAGFILTCGQCGETNHIEHYKHAYRQNPKAIYTTKEHTPELEDDFIYYFSCSCGNQVNLKHAGEIPPEPVYEATPEEIESMNLEVKSYGTLSLGSIRL